ncbi:MAG TPA: glycosyltransferase family 1 protein [Actinomycetota bacterium]|jgi:alpha-1,3-rhamnosyl/mannosyltransferase
MSRLAVGVNLLYLKPGVVGGSEDYVVRVLDALDREARDDVALTLFVNRATADERPTLIASHDAEVAPMRGDVPPLRIVAESTWLARRTAQSPLDLVHHVANTIPQVRTRPAVVTIHDLQPFVRPHDFGATKGVYLRARLRAAARRARVVMTPSEYVRRQVLDRFDLDDERVLTVPAPIVMPALSDADPNGPSSPVPEVAEPFFLYPAITHPHKNHAMLVRAFARVAADRPDVALVLTGGAGTREDAVRADVARRGLGGRVRRLGRIPRPALDALLGRAAALTFPSRHEGYGLPVAEAMALGCPVLASDAGALPEVLGDAGVLLDPDDDGAWAEAMLRILDDTALRADLVERGRRRAAALTPAETARRAVVAYRRAAG